MLLSLWNGTRVGVFIPHYVNLAHQHRAPDCHGNSDDGKIHAGEIKSAHVNVLAREDIAPEQPGKGCTEGGAEGTVIHAESHTVHSRPECAVRYGDE